MTEHSGPLLLATLGLILASSSCDGVACGEGTVNAGGACVLAVDAGPADQCCGPGTHLEANTCLPDQLATHCDPDTTTAIVLEDGARCCLGTGAALAHLSGCAITCKAPDPGKVTLCGQLMDVESGRNLEDGASGARCDPDNPTSSGPCSLRLQVYDALAFASAPTSEAALVADEIVVNDCGAWMVHNVAASPLGYLAVVTDDEPRSGQATHVVTASSVAVESGGRYPYQLTYAAQVSTVDTWTQTAGDPFGGDSFVDRGAALLIFSFGREPVAGVAVTPPGFTFADTEPYQHTIIDPNQTSTGANGSTLVMETWTASGAESPGCAWDSPLADPVPGVLWVQHVHSSDGESGERCAPPCPPADSNPCMSDGVGSCAR